MNLIKFTFLTFILLLGTFSCQQSEDAMDVSPKTSLQEIKVDDDPLLLELINEKLGSAVSGRVASTDFGDIDLSEAIKAEIPSRDITRFSLLLNSDTLTGISFQNLILEQYGEHEFMYINAV